MSRMTDPATTRVGLFGDVFPECLIEAAGGVCVAVHLPSADALPSAPEVAARIEPFVDDHVRQFLLRLAAGHHADLGAIVFCREDAAAHIAYVYAAELVRQGLAPQGPRLILWNAVHRAGAAAQRFNLRSCERLWHDLHGVGLTLPDAAALAHAHAQGLVRQQALARLEADQCADAPRVSGARALALRSAGRALSPLAHAQLIDRALAEARRAAPRSGLRIGCVGSALSSVAAHDAVEAHGTVVCDLLPLGEIWPVPLPMVLDGVQSILDHAADAALCPRIVPTGRYRAELVRRLVAARCDLVLIQLAQADDSFGWEIPDLTRDLAGHGIRVLNLGFRDSVPSADWLNRARAAVASIASEAQK